MFADGQLMSRGNVRRLRITTLLSSVKSTPDTHLAVFVRNHGTFARDSRYRSTAALQLAGRRD